MNLTMITKITYSFDFAPLFSKGTGVSKVDLEIINRLER